MTILNESGAPDVLSPLRGVESLAERLPDALIAVVGTRAEAYLTRTLPAALSPVGPRNPRVLCVVLDPEETPKQGRLASRLIEAAAGFRSMNLMLVFAGRSAGLLGLDVPFETRLVQRRLGFPVEVVELESGSSGALSTDLEDRTLAALVALCPDAPVPAPSVSPKRGSLLRSLRARHQQEAGAELAAARPVVLLGASSEPAEELAAELERVGVEVAGRVPGSVEALPRLGEGTVAAVVGPHLAATAKAAEWRGAEVVRTLAPIGVDGTARFIQDVAAAAGSLANEFGRARTAWSSLEPLRNRIRGRRIFLAGDSGLEVSLARFLADAGAVVLEVGAPRLEKKALSTELAALGSGVDVVESPDWQGQIERVDKTRPDLVISSPGLHAPMVARGHLCRSSLDFLAPWVYGYEGARRILKLLVRTFERAEALDSLDL